MPPPYQYADIVFCPNMLDPQGQNPKDRRFVVMKKYSNGTFWGVGITGTFAERDPVNVLLPWGTEDYPNLITGLTKRSVARCKWVKTYDENCITRVLGICPAPEIDQILAIYAKHPMYKFFFAKKGIPAPIPPSTIAKPPQGPKESDSASAI